MLSLQDIQQAQARIAPYIVRTPLLRVPALCSYLESIGEDQGTGKCL